MARKIFRGPADRSPHTVSLPVSGAYLPGTIVEETATALTQITTAVDKRPLVLGNLDFKDQDTVTAYTSGDTGIAFIPMPQDVFMAAMAAATYAKGAALTVGASGRLEAAGSGDVVVAFFDDTPGAYIADQLADVIWASATLKA